jgi:hypothetical protein
MKNSCHTIGNQTRDLPTCSYISYIQGIVFYVSSMISLSFQSHHFYLIMVGVEG